MTTGKALTSVQPITQLGNRNGTISCYLEQIWPYNFLENLKQTIDFSVRHCNFVIAK